MSFRIGLLFRITLTLVMIAGSAAAEERCVSQETPRQCLRRLIAAHAYEAAQAAMAAVPTGSSAATSPVQTAVHDFQTAASATVDGSSAKDSNKALTLAYNLPSKLLGASQQTNLVVTLTDPALSPAFLAASDPATIAQFKNALGHGDDVALSLALNPLSQHFGRSIDPNRALFESILFALVSGPVPTTAAIPETSFDTPFVQILPDAAARITAMIEFETASMVAMPAAAGRLTQDFVRLVSNQPQMFVTGLYHHRKPEVGPQESGYRVTWEISTDNINSFRRNGGRDCEAQGTCLAAFNDYANRTAGTHSNGRLALAIEYHTTLANDTGSASPPTTETGARELTFSAAYGREIASFISGKQGRFDFAVSYNAKHSKQIVFPSAATTAPQLARTGHAEFGSGAETQLLPQPTTRFSTTATATQPIGNGVSIPFSVGWSDQEQWLPGTESPNRAGNGHARPFSTNKRGFEAHLGIRYQPSFSKPSQPPRECCCK